jgi:hypothetical protein
MDAIPSVFSKRIFAFENWMISMEQLLSLLNELENSNLPTMGQEDIILGPSLLVERIQTYAKGYLIDEVGEPHYELIDTLYHEHNYFVRPGSRTKEGHATAFLTTKKGFIAFG